jgi:hypothetical protein
MSRVDLVPSVDETESGNGHLEHVEGQVFKDVTDVDLSVRYAFQFAALEHGEERLVWSSHEEPRRGAVREDNDGVASAVRELRGLRFFPRR